MKNVTLQSLGLDLVNINVNAKVYKNIPLGSRQGHFHCFGIWRSAKPRPMINAILQFLGLDLFNTKVSANFYQTIPNHWNGLRVWTFFLDCQGQLGKASTDEKWHFAISWTRSCQYQCLRKIYQSIPLSSIDRTIFTFSGLFCARQNLDRW